MGSWRHFIIESDRPEEALEKVSDVFDGARGRVLDDSVVVIKSFGEFISASDSRWLECSGVVDRFMEVNGNDTSDSCHGELYGFEDGEVKKIDNEFSGWLIGGDRFRGESFLRSYFYDRHGFKMWSGRSEKNSDYEDRYRPEQHLDLKHECPRCGCKNVRIDGWDAECKRCSYQDVKPRFEASFYSEIYDLREEEWRPSYDSEWRNKIARLKIRYRDLKLDILYKISSFKKIINIRKYGLPVMLSFEDNHSGKFMILHNRINNTRKGIGLRDGKLEFISRDWFYPGAPREDFDDVIEEVDDMDTPSE